MMVLDTAFLIDLQREWVAGTTGPAMQFLDKNADETMAISVISALEFLEGYARLRDGEEFLAPFLSIDVTPRISRVGSRLRRRLRKQGQAIGDFDILIAATALDIGALLVTADARHFARIPDINVVGYRD
jgi:tRNA(fMet)-specific endonuclease VapC